MYHAAARPREALRLTRTDDQTGRCYVRLCDLGALHASSSFPPPSRSQNLQYPASSRQILRGLPSNSLRGPPPKQQNLSDLPYCGRRVLHSSFDLYWRFSTPCGTQFLSIRVHVLAALMQNSCFVIPRSSRCHMFHSSGELPNIFHFSIEYDYIYEQSTVTLAVRQSL
jgi:hypothetical protein